MESILETIKTRRSTRKYKPDMPTKEEIDTVIEAGLYAPSGMNKQEVIVLAITDKALRDKMAEENRKIAGMPEGMDPFYGAPVVLVVLAEKNWPTYLYDGSLAIGNMLLVAESLGLGSCWIHRAKEEFELPEYQALLKELGVEGDYEGIGHCILGYADAEAEPALERKDGRVFYLA